MPLGKECTQSSGKQSDQWLGRQLLNRLLLLQEKGCEENKVYCYHVRRREGNNGDGEDSVTSDSGGAIAVMPVVVGTRTPGTIGGGGGLLWS